MIVTPTMISYRGLEIVATAKTLTLKWHKRRWQKPSMKRIEHLLDRTHETNVADCPHQVKAKHRPYLYTLHLELLDMNTRLILIHACRFVLNEKSGPNNSEHRWPNLLL